MATNGENRWPPVGKLMAADGEKQMAIDTDAGTCRRLLLPQTRDLSEKQPAGQRLPLRICELLKRRWNSRSPVGDYTEARVEPSKLLVLSRTGIAVHDGALLLFPCRASRLAPSVLLPGPRAPQRAFELNDHCSCPIRFNGIYQPRFIQ